uniref:Tc1-like transposase DDE domain-containing protein n=1 Tax=Panagrolaimus sp. PS1159 TaxID=55785 RepID=A0AC35G415_9BILA
MLPKIIEAGEKLFHGDYQLIQDSSSVHVSAESQYAFDEANILLFPLPPQSPDFNPIEFIWRDMKNFIKERNPKTKCDLVRVILEFWKTVTPSKCRTAIRLACRNIDRSFDGYNREHDTPTDRVYRN